ncbi:hypothetical protein CTI14_38420, partial [Methylobacterium radiotolerans]
MRTMPLNSHSLTQPSTLAVLVRAARAGQGAFEVVEQHVGLPADDGGGEGGRLTVEGQGDLSGQGLAERQGREKR